MSNTKNTDIVPETGQLDPVESNLAVSSSEVSSIAGSVKTGKTPQRISTSSERQIKFERAQKCLENAALVSKRIKEHRKATAELLGRPFEDDDGGDTASEVASTMSERTGYSVATDTSTTLSVQDALNIPGISESLANTLKQKELLMERIKQYKEISKRPAKSMTPITRDSTAESKVSIKKGPQNSDQLINTLKEKENAISVMQVKMKAMETTILDLQEKINEKDQIIEAKNMATTLISDSLSKKEKESLSLLEDTRHQMTKMQENFIAMETEWKEEKQNLLKEIHIKNDKIKSLEEANTILENARFEISLEHSKLIDELEMKNKEIAELQDRILSFTEALDEKPSAKEKDDVEEEKGSKEISDMVELTKKIEVLEQLNCQIRQTNKELENKLATLSVDSKPSSPSKKGSPLPSRKGRNTASKLKSPWSQMSSESLPQETDKKHTKNEITKLEMVVQSLNKDILEKEYIITQKDEIIAKLQEAEQEKEFVKIEKSSVDVGVSTDMSMVSESQVEEKSSEFHTTALPLNDPNVGDLETKLKEAQDQITLLKDDLDAANKNMIKVKSNHKLKLKQMQKTIDNFTKMSDANAEIVRLNDELNQLTQKVAELEEEKGNLQLHLVDYDSGRLTESDIYKKLVEMENLAESRHKAISLLESQKFDLVQEIHELQQKNLEMEDKLADIANLQSEQVSSEIKSVQMEEQIDKLNASIKELELVIDNLKLDKEQLNTTIKELQIEKDELNQKLENYIQENMDLTDRLEKLSAEKVSSAESIEIVESLTTQEKLELEEYNKGLLGEKKSEPDEPKSEEPESILDALLKRNEDLIQRNDLFTQEREEVMEKMNKLNKENKDLQETIKLLKGTEDKNNEESEERKDKPDGNLEIAKDELLKHSEELIQKNKLLTQEREEIIERISKLNKENADLHETMEQLREENKSLQISIEEFNNHKYEMQQLNQELTRQIEELKLERVEMVKETTEITKPIHDDISEITTESQADDKSNDKGMNRTKSVKQLTKEILKLKNTIKEREDEIADCQMKILSLEEQQQKQSELLKANSGYENKLKSLLEVNQQLKDEIDGLKKNNESQYQQAHDLLQQEMLRIQQEYCVSINSRDAKINELETLLVEYEKQVLNYSATLQQKDKDLTEYINQITKLNDVSQKLKSTIDLLEEEKAADPNAELVKSLNKQIVAYQKKVSDNEERLRILEDEKSQLNAVKSNLEAELKQLKDIFADNQSMIIDLQTQQQKHVEELSAVKLQTKERDEEIHEIKLQLRKESIENEKLRTRLEEKECNILELNKALELAEEKLNNMVQEKDSLREQLSVIETKNKELMEKLKKFAANIKKKSSMYSDIESQLIETQKLLDMQNQKLEQYSIQVETLPALQEKLKHAEEEVNRLQSQRAIIEQQKSQELDHLTNQVQEMEENLFKSTEEITKLNDSINILNKDLYILREENAKLNSQIEIHSNQWVEKRKTLEDEVNKKQSYIAELMDKLESFQNQDVAHQFGYAAKIQERDLYIETLETEINKYKSRICRLEESISIMEDRRHSLERKADQLGSQLQEKEKAYAEYSNQEDELVARLAVLMDHDRVLDKQLHEIDRDNKSLQMKLQQLNEENQRYKKSLSDIQEYCNTLVDKASKFDVAESESAKYKTHLQDLEIQLKKVSQEHQHLLGQKKKEIEELEYEFNAQIENAIKEKKQLGEKHEKLNEHVGQLEVKLQEYKSNNEHLNANLLELNRIHQDYIEKTSQKQQSESKDYTDQYISEINNLNAVINSKNEDIVDLTNKIQTLQSNNLSIVSNSESKIVNLTTDLESVSIELENIKKESNLLRNENARLQNIVSEQESCIKELKEKKTVSFEMNIPKTEGMFITSTIEPLSDEPKLDISALESQIMSDAEINNPEIRVKRSENLIQAQSSAGHDTELQVESIIVPKKTYLCYQGDDEIIQEQDPFNSEEGWGLGDSEVADEVTPVVSHLTQQIDKLSLEKVALKGELDASNTKLMKAMKKLKELKSSNEMLSNELRISKQISQSSFLDSAIEDELRIKVEELEKTVCDLNKDINKERKEKESLRKENDENKITCKKLLDMKERLDRELEQWKFKFYQANEKKQNLQSSSETKDSSKLEPIASATKYDTLEKYKDEIAKIERENEELQTIIDQLTAENNDLMIQHKNMKESLNNLENQMQIQKNCEKCDELKLQIAECQTSNHILLNHQKDNEDKIADLEKQLQQQQECEKCKLLKNEIKQLQESNIELNKNIGLLKEKLQELDLRCSGLNQSNETLKTSYEDIISSLNKEIEELSVKCMKLEEDNKNRIDSELKISSLEADVGNLKLQIVENQEKEEFVSKQYNKNIFELEENCSQLKNQLADAYNKIKLMENAEQKVSAPVEQTEHLEKIKELNEKIEHLNAENDNLLSTVAELRSSISSAVDQRGYEIAELWKQHLAQRETDFQKTEIELRNQLHAAENKYEQLLDSVQTSSQEETNKLITKEQLNTLQNKLQDKEEHLRELQDKYGEVISQLDMVQSEMHDEKISQDNKLMEQQEEYERIIQELHAKHKEDISLYEQSFNSIQAELTSSKAKEEELIQSVNKLSKDLEASSIKITELENLLVTKDTEIYQRTHDYTLALTQRTEEFENVRRQLLDYEKKIEELTYEKEAELAVLRLKIHEHTDYYEEMHAEYEKDKSSLTEELREKVEECLKLNKMVTDLNNSLAEDAKNISEMQVALESQEEEIISLKDEIKKLDALLKASSNKIQKHVSFASDTKPPSDINSPEEATKPVDDVVSRGELDLALYMLHQRDVRCEELTMELTQLLDERDTLQLRLSDSLRSNEELKSKIKDAGMEDVLDGSRRPVTEQPSFSVERETPFVDVHKGLTSRSSSLSDPDGDKPKLQAKLSELRTVHHSRDYRLRQDSELRQMDMRLMQRDLANLPPEAVEQLAQHTLSRDSQSTSTVLLNWIRGKSTPKVVDM